MRDKLLILGAFGLMLELGSNKTASFRFVPTNAGPTGRCSHSGPTGSAWEG